MSCIDIHLRKNIEKLRFLELPKEYFRDCDDFIYDNEIQVPIFTDYLEEMILKKKEGISIGEALKSMGYVMGIDKDFKYNNLYFKIIQKYISNPTAFFLVMPIQNITKVSIGMPLSYYHVLYTFIVPNWMYCLIMQIFVKE